MPLPSVDSGNGQPWETPDEGNSFILARTYGNHIPAPGQETEGRKAPDKTPGSNATAAAVRSLRPHAGPRLSLPESLDWLYTHHARFVLLCDRCDYDRPRCQRRYPDLPAGSLKWGSWQPTPDDAPADTAFAPGGSSSDDWGVPIRHLPVDIELASPAMAAFDVDLYDLPILAGLVKTAAPPAITTSPGGDPLTLAPCRPHAFDLPPMVVPSVLCHRQASVLRGTVTTLRLYSASRATASE